MKRVLIKCGWLVTLDPTIGEIKGGELLYQRQHHRGRGPQPRRDRRRDDRRLRQDRHAGPGQRPHAHLGDGAARHRRRVDVGGLFQARAFQSGDALQARGQLRRQPDGRAGADRRRRHHAGRLVPQHHHASSTPSARSTAWSTAASARCSPTAPPSRSASRPARRSPTCRIRASASRRCARAGSRATTAASRWRWRSSVPTGAPGRWSSTTSAWRASSASCRRRTPGGARTAWCRTATRGWPRRACSGPTTTSCTARATTPPICASWSTAARR